MLIYNPEFRAKLFNNVSLFDSGLGYITGGETARATNQWQWGLRITPILGVFAIIMILTLVRDPIRGEKEGGSHISSSSWSDDIKALLKK